MSDSKQEDVNKGIAAENGRPKKLIGEITTISNDAFKKFEIEEGKVSQGT